MTAYPPYNTLWSPETPSTQTSTTSMSTLPNGAAPPHPNLSPTSLYDPRDEEADVGGYNYQLQPLAGSSTTIVPESSPRPSISLTLPHHSSSPSSWSSISYGKQSVDLSNPLLAPGAAEQWAVEQDPYLVTFAPTDPRHPWNWSALKRWTILLVVCSAAVCVTVASSIQASTYSNLEDEFDVPRIEAVAGVSLYVLGFGIGARMSMPNECH